VYKQMVLMQNLGINRKQLIQERFILYLWAQVLSNQTAEQDSSHNTKVLSTQAVWFMAFIEILTSKVRMQTPFLDRMKTG